MRDELETEKDRDNEFRIAHIVANEWGMEAFKLKPFYPVDFAFFRHGLLTSWNEIKCRDHMLGKYQTVILSQHKLTAGIALARDTLAPFNFIVEFQDGIYYCPLLSHNCHFPVRLGGRYDRDDPQDIEPCAHIPVNLFRRI